MTVPNCSQNPVQASPHSSLVGYYRHLLEPSQSRTISKTCGNFKLQHSWGRNALHESEPVPRDVATGALSMCGFYWHGSTTTNICRTTRLYLTMHQSAGILPIEMSLRLDSLRWMKAILLWCRLRFAGDVSPVCSPLPSSPSRAADCSSEPIGASCLNCKSYQLEVDQVSPKSPKL